MAFHISRKQPFRYLITLNFHADKTEANTWLYRRIENRIQRFLKFQLFCNFQRNEAAHSFSNVDDYNLCVYISLFITVNKDISTIKSHHCHHHHTQTKPALFKMFVSLWESIGEKIEFSVFDFECFSVGGEKQLKIKKRKVRVCKQ